jgi:hypothetical protein
MAVSVTDDNDVNDIAGLCLPERRNKVQSIPDPVTIDGNHQVIGFADVAVGQHHHSD